MQDTANIPNFDEKHLLKDKKGNPVLYHDKAGRVFFFFHEFCGGRIIPEKSLESAGYRICNKCKERFPPYLIHKKDSLGKACGGRIIFTDDVVPSPAFLRQSRTYERRCGACNYEEKYSDDEIVVVFCEGMTKEQAINFIKTVDRGLVPVRTKEDNSNPNIVALYIKAKPNIIETLESYEGKVLAASKILKH